MPPPDSLSAPGEGEPAPALGEGSKWRVIATPYTGEKHARGLAARTHLPRGTLIEVAPCLTISPAEYAGHGSSVRALACYAFADPGRSGGHLLALGCGSLFNHARIPNVDYRVDFSAATIRFYAARDVVEGEELTISYGRVWWEEEAGGDGSVGATMPGAPTRPAHDHMDDEGRFLGAIGIGLEEGGDGGR